MLRGAVLSNCTTYRFQLSRQVDKPIGSKLRVVGFVLNNPSTADGEYDDATVLKCWRYAEMWGFNGMVFVNTNPFRSTDPKAQIVPPPGILDVNDYWLRDAQVCCELLVCGWGDKAKPDLAKRAVQVLYNLGPLFVLRITKSGNPQHPLYLPGALTPTRWSPEKWLH